MFKKILGILFFIAIIYIIYIVYKKYSEKSKQKKINKKKQPGPGQFLYKNNIYTLQTTILELISTDGMRWCYYDVERSTASVIPDNITDCSKILSDLSGATNQRVRKGVDFCEGHNTCRCTDKKIKDRRDKLKKRLTEQGYTVIEDLNSAEYNKLIDIILKV